MVPIKNKKKKKKIVSEQKLMMNLTFFPIYYWYDCLFHYLLR